MSDGLWLVFLIGTSSCSFLLTKPLSADYANQRDLDCTTNIAPPVIDTILTITNLVSAAYVSGQNNVMNKDSSVGLGIIAAGIWASSAVYGYSSTSKCQDVRQLRADESYAPSGRSILRSPPPYRQPTPAPDAWAAPPQPVEGSAIGGAFPAQTAPGTPGETPAAAPTPAPATNVPLPPASPPVPAAPPVPQQLDDDDPARPRRPRPY